MTADRLDQILVARGLVPTRSRARDLIRRGLVLVDGRINTRPGVTIGAAAAVTLAPAAPDYVSRGAEKLAAALDHFSLDVAGRIALDVGASTGGFTDLLLRRAAARVYAVDVGHGQLNSTIAADPRVIAYEHTDARTLTREHVPDPLGAIVADVSFISLTKVLPAALALAAPGCWLVALVKPQFEVGPDLVGRGGIVRDETARARAVATVYAWIGAQPGWTALGVIPSPITGGSGNQEYLLGAIRD